MGRERKRLLKTTSGFSLIEVMLAITIMTIVTLSVLEVTLYLRNMAYDTDKTEVDVAWSSVQGLIHADILASEFSLNAMLIKDDSGIRDFFEYDATVTCVLPGANCARNLTLEACTGGQGPKRLILVTSRSSLPQAATLPIPGSFFPSTGFDYNNLNATLNTAWGNDWSQSSPFVLFLSTNDYFKQVGPNAYRGRKYFHFSMIDPSDGSYSNLPNAVSHFLVQDHPTIPSTIITDIPTYFSLLSPVGGTSFMALAKPVEFVEYSVEDNPQPIRGKPTSRWVRRKLIYDSTLNQWVFGAPTVLHPKVLKVVFSREINRRLLSYDLRSHQSETRTLASCP